MPISLDQVLTNAASGMSAQSVRLNTIASNLANANSVGSSEDTTYHAKYPIFTEVTDQSMNADADGAPVGGVEVTDIKNSGKPLQKKYDPENPMANKDGFVFLTDVNPIEEMTNMISASKEYQANVEVMNTAKNMIMQSLGVLSTK